MIIDILLYILSFIYVIFAFFMVLAYAYAMRRWDEISKIKEEGRRRRKKWRDLKCKNRRHRK